MKILYAAPILRVLIPFVAGILFAIYFSFESRFGVIIFILLFILVLFFTFKKQGALAYRRAGWYGLLLNISFLAAGYAITVSQTDLFFPAHVSTMGADCSYAYARIAAPCIEKGKSVKTIIELIAVKDHNSTKPVFGKVLTYFQKDKRSLGLKYGDELFLHTKFQKINTTRNPGGFDFRRFMFYKKVYCQTYLNPMDWACAGKNSGNFLINYSLCLRDKLLALFNSTGLMEEEFAVAAALMIGYMDKLDATLMANYSRTGVLHVLSVSGLHVAIVFVVFNWLLFFFDRIKYGAIIKTALLISFLWLYAILTGLSPSVLRSATMFSFIVFAKQFRRNTVIYNTLAASALILLLHNPCMIMDVGFQLSYLAVAGILFIEPVLSKKIKTDNWLWNYIASLLSVSIAAQMATLPISLYYFHQFPVYFLLANLLVIPLSTVIIYTGILLIISSCNTFFLTYLSAFFPKMVSLMNGIVMVIHELPYAVVDGVFISISQTIFLYGCIVFSMLYIIRKQTVFFTCILLNTIGFLIIQCQQQQQQLLQKKWIVYDIPHKHAIEFIYGREHLLLTDALLNKNSYEFLQLKTYWNELGLYPLNNDAGKQMKCIFIKEGAIQFFNKRFIWIKTAEKIKKYQQQPEKIAVDVVIISNDAIKHVQEVLNVYQAALILFDSSNSFYKMSNLKKECLQLHQPFYSVQESGAFTGML